MGNHKMWHILKTETLYTAIEPSIGHDHIGYV